MAKEFINPNWHVILIHYPLGIFVLGVVIELFSFLYRRGTLRVAGRWMILIGALSAIPTALSGVYALANVVRMDLPQGYSNPDRPWREITGVSRINTDQWEHLRRHAWAQAGSTALAAAVVTVALGCSDRWRRRLYVPLMLLLLLSLSGMVWGAYYGGEMVYRHGIAVQRLEAKGAMAEASVPKPSESAADEQTEQKKGVERYVPPLQLHVVLAGLAVAVALGALGLSARAIATADEVDAGKDLGEDLERDMLYEPPVRGGPAAIDVVRSINPDTGVTGRPRRLPVSRLWLLAAFIALGAAAAGAWFLVGTDEKRVWEPKRLWSMVRPTADSPGQRRFVHVIAGGTIVVVPLLLAGVTRVSRRPKGTVTILALVLLAAVAVQVWLGLLLMLDTPAGPLMRFNSAGAPTSQPATQPILTASGDAG